MTRPFPDTMDFGGYNAPSRVECDIFDLEIEGTLPPDINGAWYRLTPDPQYPSRFEDDTYLNGDGMISVFRFQDGHVDFRSRYVMTERLRNDRAARRALYGIYRNPYTDDPSVHGTGRGVANTTPVWHGGKLLALKEDSLPMEVEPQTLATLGEWNFGGQLRSRTMTAHPRHDPETGELLSFGYEAAGLATRDVSFFVINRDGELVREEWFQAPYVSLMHDFAVTREHVIFPVFPTTADLKRIEAGGAHWVWEPQQDTFVGIMPRDGRVEDMRWFRGPAQSAFHILNAYTDGARVHMDLSVTNVNVFPFIQRASGLQVDPRDMQGSMARWTFDLSQTGDAFEETVIGPAGDMPRIADAHHMRDYDVGYYQRYDPAFGPPLIAGPVGAGFNVISRLEVKSGRMRNFSPGPQCTVQEHIHVPSSQPGHEGYLLFVTDLHDQFLSEVHVLDAADIEKGPLARIKVPHRLRVQVHGNWVPAANLH